MMYGAAALRVLVTGGAGYIGSHTAKALSRAGHEPIVIDNLSTGHRSSVRWGPFVRGDIGDRKLVRETLERHAVEAVMHFAGSAYVGESMSRPEKYFRNNVVSGLELLEAMREAGARMFVFSSSCTIYGDATMPLISEQAAHEPVNPYGDSKLFFEKALRWYGEAHDFRWIALRYFNVAGADPSGELGEMHDPETHLIPLAVKAALGERSHLGIFGDDYETPDGTAIRDYIHVSDIADAHVAGLLKLREGLSSQALNLGTSRGHSVREVVAAVERASGRRCPVRNEPRRAGDPPRLVADASRAREQLGWTAQRSDLDTIVATAWRWHASQQGASAN